MHIMELLDQMLWSISTLCNDARVTSRSCMCSALFQFFWVILRILFPTEPKLLILLLNIVIVCLSPVYFFLLFFTLLLLGPPPPPLFLIEPKLLILCFLSRFVLIVICRFEFSIFIWAIAVVLHIISVAALLFEHI